MADLDTIYLHVTGRCPFSCSYCYLDGAITTELEMSTEDWLAFFPQIVDQNPRKVVITGGEPLMRGDLLVLLRGFRQLDRNHKIELALDTSGIGLTEELARIMAGVVDRVRVSIDGPEKVNDKQRSSGSYSAALTALRNLITAGFEPEAGVTLTTNNIKSLTAFVEQLTDMGCMNISISSLRPIGGAESHPEWVPRLEEMRAAVNSVRNSLGLPEPREQITGNTCGVGRYLSILPDGSVFPCHVLHLPEFKLGNINTDTLENIHSPGSMLSRLAELNIRELSRKYPDLTDLKELDVCMGHVYRNSPSHQAWRNMLK